MIDRDKVLKGLECCFGSIGKACPMECPYRVECLMQDDEYNMYSVMHDALKLLKEQPEQKHGHWIEYPKCLEYDGALDDTYIVCSACEHVFNVIDNCTELFDYCPKCGAKMNEENEKEK